MLANQDGRLLSLKQVLVELREGKDDLSTWAENEGKKLFSSCSVNIGSPEHMEVNDWIGSSAYEDGAKTEFSNVQCADQFLIAGAKAGGHVLVTHEKSNNGNKKKVKIPDVCKALGIECMNTFEMLEREMLEREKPRFVLAQ